jgi:hypothetical protein
MMIVIATHDGYEFLPRLLRSMEEHGTDNHKICIMDTGSTDEATLQYLDGLDRSKYIVDQTPYKRYDTGAYIHAYRKYAEDEYLFLHDSLEVLTDDWLADFKSFNTEVCYYTAFVMRGLFPEQTPYLKRVGIWDPNVVHGVFGPIFYTNRGVLNAINQRFDLDALMPTNKSEQMGMELGWGMMIASVTTSIGWLGNFETWLAANAWGSPITIYKSLRKYRPVRK